MRRTGRLDYSFNETVRGSLAAAQNGGPSMKNEGVRILASKKYASDIEAVLATRHDNGGDYWASTDGRFGSPC